MPNSVRLERLSDILFLLQKQHCCINARHFQEKPKDASFRDSKSRILSKRFFGKDI